MEVSQVSSKPRVASQATAARVPLITALLPGIVALLPRMLHLNDFLTTDEAYHWITRTERFSAAIAEVRWLETIQTGHPGVTVMWLGSLGLALERWLLDIGWAQVATRVEHLAWLRFPVALLHGLLVPAGYLLLRRLIRPTTALIAALLWATSPWLVAYGRILHLDMLLTNFVFLSLLLLLQPPDGQRTIRPHAQSAIVNRLPSIVCSGVLCGLALLTKGPALILLPVAGLVLFFLPNDQRPTPKEKARPSGLFFRFVFFILHRSSLIVPLYLIWLMVALLVVFALWPALWVDPVQALGRYTGEIIGNGGRPNGDGQFFLGTAIGDPGPLFYPLAMLFRLTPLEMIGLLACFGFLIVKVRKRGITRSDAPFLALAFFAAFWLLVMTLGPKKFDRYVLPVWPALLVFAAAGLTEMRDWGAETGKRLAFPTLRRRPSTLRLRSGQASSGTGRAPNLRKDASRWATILSIVFVCLLQLPLLTWYHPYYLSYYNPLLGGGPVAQRTLLIGWGEGMDQVGAYLRTRPDIGNGMVASALPPTLQPFVPVPVKNVLELGDGPANYAVVYLESIQRGASPEIYAQIRQTTPLHRVTIHGIEYAEIYQLPRPYQQPVEAQFGDGLRLRGITVEQAQGSLTLTPSWDVRAAPPADYWVFVRVFNSAGQPITGIDVPPGGNSVAPTSAWQPGEQIAVPLPIRLPAELSDGDYQLVMGVYDPVTGARLPLTGGHAADPAAAGPNALLLTTVTLARR